MFKIVCDLKSLYPINILQLCQGSLLLRGANDEQPAQPPVLSAVRGSEWAPLSSLQPASQHFITANECRGGCKSKNLNIELKFFVVSYSIYVDLPNYESVKSQLSIFNSFWDIYNTYSRQFMKYRKYLFNLHSIRNHSLIDYCNVIKTSYERI